MAQSLGESPAVSEAPDRPALTAVPDLPELLEDLAASQDAASRPEEIGDGLEAMVLHPDYPCLGARSVFKRDRATVVVLEDLATDAATTTLVSALTSFGQDPPDSYERLLLDCNLGDSTLFARRDEVELAWQFIDPILETWSRDQSPPLVTYAAGTWGPPEADALVHQHGRHWYRL